MSTKGRWRGGLNFSVLPSSPRNRDKEWLLSNSHRPCIGNHLTKVGHELFFQLGLKTFLGYLVHVHLVTWSGAWITALLFVVSETFRNSNAIQNASHCEIFLVINFDFHELRSRSSAKEPTIFRRSWSSKNWFTGTGANFWLRLWFRPFNLSSSLSLSLDLPHIPSSLPLKITKAEAKTTIFDAEARVI